MDPLQYLRDCLDRGGRLSRLRDAVSQSRPLVVTGAAGGLPPLVLDRLAGTLARPLVVVVPDLRRGHDLRAALEALAPENTVVLLPPLDADPYSGVSAHPDTMRTRVEALSRLSVAEETASVVAVVPVRGLAVPLPEPEEFASWMLTLRRDQEYDLHRLREDLTVRGYLREDAVGSRGEFASRGYILDVFPVDRELPLRLEFFGDTLTSIRPFDAATQRSLAGGSEGELEVLDLPPMREYAVSEETPREWASAVTGGNAPAAARWSDSLEREGSFPGYELLHWAEDKPRADLDRWLGDPVVLVLEPEACRSHMEAFYRDLARSYEGREAGILPPPEAYLVPEDQVRGVLDRAAVHLNPLGSEESREDLALEGRPAVRYQGDLPRLLQDVEEYLDREGTVVLLLETRGTLDRLREILEGRGLLAGDRAGRLLLGIGRLTRGFELPWADLLVLTDRDLHADRPPSKERRQAPQAEGFLSDLRDLQEGDLVVHTDHGIGTYRGIRTLAGPAGARDFLILEYRGGDKLYQPLERLDVIQKYSGVSGVSPRLDKLGGTSWKRVKSRVRKDMQDMTKELLELYSQRMAARGHAFGPDQPWQREFEEAFPYQETPDQDQAIRETKADMESPRPMDRLVVGDVGFGKTEVAMRAAMKAVLDGKQVAVLAPTTVLSFQHHRTFTRRFADYPVRVDLLSRFRSKAEQKETLEALARGEADIVVGTHRLLSKDIRFKDLGLLVVDEEQRFGVRHKERLKELKKDVDVLTLTATPIPRTLQMALGGLRDLSLIRTPPAGRYAIQTEVVPFRGEVVRHAIERELERDGQVYFVHNRVQSIHSMADMVRKLVPDQIDGGRVLVAHGQMPEGELEETILAFVRGEAEILVTTTIIENGIDIPRVNTIIVNRADTFGLAQLYQLRGRVGRSEEQAFAYLLVPSLEGISEVARKRLRALKDFSTLGSGFRLAAMDLEIRGAGSLLGAQQSGHIAAVGFEEYCRLLENTAAELRGEEVREEIEAKVAINLDLHLPETYVPEQGERLSIYKRITSARSVEDLERVVEEVKDQYGHPPQALENLARVARVRILAGRLLIEAVETSGRKLVVRFPQETRADLQALVQWMEGQPGVSLSPQGILEVPLNDRDPGELALGLLRELD